MPSNIKQSGCISIKSMRTDLNGDYYLRFKDENLILDKLQVGNHEFNVESSFKVRFPFISDDLRCIALESFHLNGHFLVADRETCKCYFKQYDSDEAYLKSATWAVVKLNEEESEEDNVLEVFQELQEAE